MDLDPCSIYESTPPPPHAVKVRSRGGLGLIEQQSDTNQIGCRGSGNGCICISAPALEPHPAAPAMSPSGEVVASVSSALAVLLVLLACVVLGDAAAAVGVYRLIQYDLAGAPLGSRTAALNNHAAAFPLPAGADISCSTLIAPLLDLPLSFLREYQAEKKHLGGLLILLPRNISAKNVEGNNDDKGEPKNVLAELEKLLMHEEVPRFFILDATDMSWYCRATMEKT